MTGDGGFDDHFSECAEGYARFRPGYPPELGDRLVALVDLVSDADRVWEAGCGSGQLTRLLAERFPTVVAADASAAQLALAPELPRVEYRVASAEDSGLEPASVVLAIAAQAAHWFDLPAYYREVRRVVRPGGAVALIAYGRPELEGALDPILRAFHTDTLGPHWPAGRRLVDEGYRTLPFPFDEIEGGEYEILARWTVDEMIGYARSWSAVQRLIAAEGAATLEGFAGRLRERWAGAGVRRTVRWPLVLRAGRVHGTEGEG